MIQNVESNSIQYKLVHTLFTRLINYVTKVFDMVEWDQPYGDKYKMILLICDHKIISYDE